MKNKCYFNWIVCALISLLSFELASAADVNHFWVSSTIAQPVTIKTNLGTFTFSGSYTLNGHISRLEAYDYYGNKIVNTQPYKYERGTERNINWYRFTDIYENDSNSESSYSEGGSDNGFSSLGQGIGQALAYGMVAGTQKASGWGRGRYKIDLSLGYGHNYGIVGGQLSFRFPKILGLSCGVGIEPWRFEKINWSVGGQIWFTNSWNIEASLIQILDDMYWGFSTGLDIHLFGPIGLKGDIGITSNKNFLFDVGLIFRLYGN